MIQAMTSANQSSLCFLLAFAENLKSNSKSKSFSLAAIPQRNLGCSVVGQEPVSKVVFFLFCHFSFLNQSKTLPFLKQIQGCTNVLENNDWTEYQLIYLIYNHFSYKLHEIRSSLKFLYFIHSVYLIVMNGNMHASFKNLLLKPKVSLIASWNSFQCPLSHCLSNIVLSQR